MSRPPFDVANLVSLLGISFSAEQLAAITAPLQPYVVVAGAGTGKTTVMTARVVWLVATGQVAPEGVLGLTFTNKAAGELADRVRTALVTLSDSLDGVPLAEVGEPTISTYHAFAGRLLAEHGLRIGVEPGSRLLTEAASVQLAHRVVTRTSRDLSVLGRAVGTLVQRVRQLDSELAEHCVEPVRLREFDLALVAEIEALAKISAGSRDLRLVALERAELTFLVEEFRAARQARDLVDFSDQMRFGTALAQDCPEVGAALREQFPVVLLDEYQDTSVAQRVLLTGLFGGGHPVTAVGDPLQAIYGWRGASVANIDDFPRQFPRADGTAAPTLPLAENRRSGVRILEAANTLAAPLRAAHPQVAPLVCPEATTARGALRVSLHTTYAEELAWVGDRVLEQVKAGRIPDEIAVLARQTSDIPALLRTLGERGLPVEVVGLDGMLAMPEVAEVIAMLEVLHDSTANPSLVRLLAGPRWRIGLRDLALLGERAGFLSGGPGRLADDADVEDQLDAAVAGVDPADIVSLLDALDDPGELSYDPAARERFAALAAEIRTLRRGVGDPLPDLVHRIVTVTGLDVELAASPEVLHLRRAEGLAAFVELVAGFVDSEGDTGVGAFLGWLSVASRFDSVPQLDRPAVPGAVQLMTMHRSKGLEWPVVVLPMLTIGVFPNARGITKWTSTATALPFPLRGDAASMPHLGGFVPKDYAAFTQACKEHGQVEDLRLAYVAITRAKTLIIASSAWWGPHQKDARGPSPYLEVLRELCIDGAGDVDVWAARPDDDATNPAADDVQDTPWPVTADAAVTARRLEAAHAVRAATGQAVVDLRAEHAALDASQAPSSPLAGLDASDLATVRGWDDDIDLLLTERRAERSAVRVVPLPSSLSASDLVRLAADPDLFARRLARPLPSAPAQAARRGTRFHAWVEAHYGLAPLLEPDDLPGAADPDIESDSALAAMQQAFLASPYAGRSPVAIEVPFAVVLGGRVVPGRIDAVFSHAAADGSTRYEVVDWKTSARQTADPLQLAIYRVAYAELLGVPLEHVEAAFVYVRDGSGVTFDDLPDRHGLERLLLGE